MGERSGTTPVTRLGHITWAMGCWNPPPRGTGTVAAVRWSPAVFWSSKSGPTRFGRSLGSLGPRGRWRLGIFPERNPGSQAENDGLPLWKIDGKLVKFDFYKWWNTGQTMKHDGILWNMMKHIWKTDGQWWITKTNTAQHVLNHGCRRGWMMGG